MCYGKMRPCLTLNAICAGSIPTFSCVNAIATLQSNQWIFWIVNNLISSALAKCIGLVTRTELMWMFIPHVILVVTVLSGEALGRGDSIGGRDYRTKSAGAFWGAFFVYFQCRVLTEFGLSPQYVQIKYYGRTVANIE